MHYKLYPKTPCINVAESTRYSKIRYTFKNISKYNMAGIHIIIVRHTDCQSEGDTWTVPAPKTSKMMAIKVFLHFLYTENCQQVWSQPRQFCRKKLKTKQKFRSSFISRKKLCAAVWALRFCQCLCFERLQLCLSFTNAVIVRESKTS